MVKYKGKLKKLSKFSGLRVKLARANRKKLVAGAAVALLLVGVLGAVLYLVNNKKSDQKSAGPVAVDQSKVGFIVNENNCKQNIQYLEGVNTDNTSSQDAIKVLTRRANCYLAAGQYDQAQKDFTKMQQFCESIHEERCVSNAKSGLKLINSYKAQSSAPKNQPDAEDVTPEFGSEVRKEGGLEQ